MLVPIIDGTKGRQDRCSCRAGGQPPGLLPAPDGFSNSRPRKSDAYRGSPSSRSDDPGRHSSRGKALADFTVTKVVGRAVAAGLRRKIARPRFIRVCAAVCASAQRLWTRRRKISALFGVQLLGSSPIILMACTSWIQKRRRFRQNHRPVSDQPGKIC